MIHEATGQPQNIAYKLCAMYNVLSHIRKFHAIEKMDNSKLSLDIRIPEGCNIQLNQGGSFENFIEQFQPLCDKILCIVGGNTLRYYDRDFVGLIDLRFSQRHGGKYYFHDSSGVVYCVFGKEEAKAFCPCLNSIEEPIPKTKRLSIIGPVGNPPKAERPYITITDKGVTFSFLNPNYSVDVRKIS